ncbi:MAG: polysaccharide deacetylase family protein [Fuerstiella sp.]
MKHDALGHNSGISNGGFTNSDIGNSGVSRRAFLAGAAAAASLATSRRGVMAAPQDSTAKIAITLDLEMSRHYPRRGMLEWDYQKGNLDEPTKDYSVRAAELVRERGGVIHFFCVARVLEQPDVGWLKSISEAGHPVGNHTYDHVNVLAQTPEETQFRFRRSPWLVRGQAPADIIRENIRIAAEALRDRAGIEACGFRTPGGFADGLSGREDVQQMLLELGYPWVSSRYVRHLSGEPHVRPGEDVFADIVRAQQQSQPFVYPSGLIEIPMSPISDVTAFRSHFWKLGDFLTAIRRSVQWAIDHGGVFDFLCHPSCMVVEDPDFETVKLICDMVRDAGPRAEICGLDRIAASVTAG